jgi:hypothetical protein
VRESRIGFAQNVSIYLGWCRAMHETRRAPERSGIVARWGCPGRGLKRMRRCGARVFHGAETRLRCTRSGGHLDSSTRHATTRGLAHMESDGTHSCFCASLLSCPRSFLLFIRERMCLKVYSYILPRPRVAVATVEMHRTFVSHIQ